MSFSRVAALGVFPLALGLSAACGSSGQPNQASSTTGTGGTTATTTTGTTATTSSTTTGTGGSGGGEGMPSNTYPGAFPAPPQVVNGGGPVLASPKIVPVFFSDDADMATIMQIEDFVSKVGATQYWTAATTEYGVGPAVGQTPVTVTDPAAPSNTIADSAIQTWLAGLLNSNDPSLPAADDNTVYALFFPQQVTITTAGGPGGSSSSCTSFGGYHDNITLDANHATLNVAYAVVPRCASFDMMTGIDAVTATASHELAEAVTDPYPSVNPAWVEVDEAHFYWSRALGGSEVGDMCAQFDGSFTKFSELPYIVQRIWSNKAALAGQDPCVPPLPGEVYFAAAPVLNDTISLMAGGQAIMETGVKIEVGKSRAIDLDLWSDASTGGPFFVHVDDVSSLNGGAMPLLSFAFAKQDPIVPCPAGDPAGAVCASGQNGQKLHLTVTVNMAGKRGYETFFVVSQRTGDPNETLWVGMVGQ